jgi:hypothetical protein
MTIDTTLDATHYFPTLPAGTAKIPGEFVNGVGLAGTIVNADVASGAAITGTKITAASTSVRGTVLESAAHADATTFADLAAAVTYINALLAKLRTAGILA